ncbi:MAG: TM0106 family RecB-like putative nuclease [Propionibacteriaceae bacterium]|jgi:predicted RecB family nuclease|nr:TM0106 family RecB-like putative nuclease [Propionibacteriaceae bacterium]
MEFTLDAYAARTCPVKTYNAFSGQLAAAADIPPRFPGSAEFTRKVLAMLTQTDSVADLRGFGPSSAEQESACLKAMDSGVDLILGGLVPRDTGSHRGGRIPLLVRDRRGDGYYPAVVKYQRVTEQREAGHYEYSTLADPTEHQTLSGHRFRWHWRAGTALQLAHYWRLLQACERAAASGALGGVIGTDELIEDLPVISWIDLAEPNIQVGPETMATPLQVYEEEFAKRVAIAQRAAAGDEAVAAEMTPIITSECEPCVWRARCVTRLDPDDLSLRISKTPLSALEIVALRQAGVVTTRQLAALDLEGFLPQYLPQVEQRPGAEERIRLAKRRSVLMQSGIELERTTTGPITVPGAALEVDIDLETSREDRVYLWGFWVHDTVSGAAYYRPFVAFDHLDDASELKLARDAMSWLEALVTDTDALVYHYSDYETVRIARLASSTHDEQLRWAQRYSQSHFVDLFKIVRANFFGTHGLGLKTVAHHGAGFAWRDEDPGGLNSMRWFEDAVGGESDEIRDQAAGRVLEYNEDDVRATWVLRKWLREQT